MPKLLRPAAPRLIRSHPLAVGLVDAVLFNGDRGRNYATEAVQPAFFGAMAAEPTADSPGSRASGGTNYATLSPSYNVAAGASTVSVLWKPVSNSSQFTTMLEKANGGSREWAFFVNYSFSLGNISYYTIGTSLSGDVDLATAMTAGGTYRFTVTRDTAGLISLYVNGALKATTTNGATTAVAGSIWYIGKAVSGAPDANAVFGDLFVWPTRALSADEVMQHAAEPWAMLRPRTRLLKAGALAAIAGTSAVTLSPFNGSAAGAAAIAGTSAVTPGRIAAAGAATLAIAGTSAITVRPFTGVASGLAVITAAAAVTLRDVAGAASGAVAVAGTSGVAVRPFLSAATGALSIVGTASVALRPWIGAATGVNPYNPTQLAAAPAWATLTWPLGNRAVVWATESRAIAWATVNRTITWRGSEMPDRVFVIPPAHVEDELPYSFEFQGFGSGDDVASYTVTVPTGVTLLDDASSGQIVTTQLGATAAGTHRIIVRAVSDAGSKATLEADWTVSDPE